MELTRFQPEARYQLTVLESDLDPKTYIGTVVHVHPSKYDFSTEELYVLIGEKFGVIHVDELSIYDFDRMDPVFFSKFISWKPTISAEVISYDYERQLFVLSRKRNMQNALDFFRNNNDIQYLDAYKINATNRHVYLDIGCGIYGFLHASETSTAYISDVSDYFKDTNYIRVKILSENENLPGKFFVSRKTLVSYKKFYPGDIVLGKITGALPDNSGIFVELSPIQSGITNIPQDLQVLEGNSKTFYIFNSKYGSPQKCLITGNYYKFRVKRVKLDGLHFKLALL